MIEYFAKLDYFSPVLPNKTRYERAELIIVATALSHLAKENA